jgi:hypothetical protein
MIQEIGMSKKEQSKWKKDPSFITLVQVFLLVEVVLLILKDYVYLGEYFWIALIVLGISFTLFYDTLMRDLHKKNRWSSFIRLTIGIILLCLGLGLIYGFRELIPIYGSIIFSFVIFFLFQKKQMKRE